MEYELYRDSANQYRWRHRSSNYKIIADSGESYFNKSDCQHGINLVKGSTGAPVRDRT